MKLDEEYLRSQCKLVMDGEDVDWDRSTVAANLVTALDEIRRLIGIIKEAEQEGEDRERCPWCNSWRKNYPKATEPHADTCPAFLPDGTVR